MKTTSNLLFITLFLFFAAGIKAQDPYFMNKEGMVLTFVNKDAKGKVTGYSNATVTKVEGNATNCTVSYETMVMDAKKKPLLSKPIQMKVNIVNGAAQLDPAALVGTLSEGMQVSGGSLSLPNNLSVGDVFDDYTVNIAIGPVKSTSTFSGIKVIAEETLDVGGKAIACMVVESVVSSRVIGIKTEVIQKVWYGRSIGIIKNESYDKKGKIQTIQELLSIEGL